VRVDSGVVTGSVIPGTFDSMMAKLIVTGATRAEAIVRARRALKEFRIEGVASVLPFHRAVLEQPDFTADTAEGFKVHTRWIETDFANDLEAAVRVVPVAHAALHRTVMEIDGRRVSLGLPAEWLAGLSAGSAPQAAAPAAAAEDAHAVRAAVTGTLHAWQVADGDQVQAGDVVAVMEAMKMEMQVTAQRAGRITLQAEAGSFQQQGATIARIE